MFSITLCWASSYIFIKDVPADFSSYAYLTLTSGTAGIILTIVFRRLFRLMNRTTLVHGIILAMLISGNILLEKLGLDRISASAASTIASSSIIIVPLILILRKQYPNRNQLTGIIIIIAGIVVSHPISMKGSGLMGTLYMLASCVLMSLYTVLATEFTKKSNPLLLTILQLCLTGLLGLVMWIGTEGNSFSTFRLDKGSISYIMLLAFFSKAYAYIMLMYADKYADALSVTVVASTEPVVTVLLALLIPNAQGSTAVLSWRSLIGALIIMGGAIVAGTEFLSTKKTASQESEKKAEPEVRLIFEKNIKQFLQPFLYVTVIFAGIGIAVMSLMEFADGFSEVRPENFLTVFSGLLFGPAGALGCAVGNLITDLFFGDYGTTMILGFCMNFLAAYIPYKLWNAVNGRRLHVHSWKNLFLYIWFAALGCLACSAMLGGVLEWIYKYYEEIIPLTFANNLVFSLALGLPTFIVLTNEHTSIPFYMPKRTVHGTPSFSCFTWGIVAADTICFGMVFILSLMDLHSANSLIARIFMVLSILCIAGTICLPCRK